MAELALRTTELLAKKAKYTAWKPVGSAIVCQSDHTICRKWLEICCDLVSPKKRENYRGIPGWKRLCDAWIPEMREAWLEYDRPVDKWPLGRLLQDHVFCDLFWSEMIESTGVVGDLPLAPESDMTISKTWLWSEIERKRFFIVANADSESPVVDNWNGADERAGDKGLVLCPKRMVNYETEIGLDGAKLDKIAQLDTIVHPDFATPVAVALIKQPDILKIKEVKEVKP